MSQESPSIRQLVSDVAKDAKHLLQTQAELAKLESGKAKGEASAMGGLFAVAAVTGALGGIFLLVTIAWILVALGLDVWAGFGIVTLVLFIIAAVAGLMGKKKADTFKPMNTTKAELDRTKKVLSGGMPETSLVLRPTASVPKQR